jgi:hypothetical protein
MRLICVGTRHGNAFMNEILEAVAFEARQLGVEAETSTGGFSEEPDAVHVVIPHEYFAVTHPSRHPSADQLRRTIAFCVEQPGTTWFETSAHYARQAGGVVDTNPLGRDEMRRRGIAAEHFQLGYTSRWDRWGGTPSPRPVDVMHLGTEAPRRLYALALCAERFSSRDVRLLLPRVEPTPHGKVDFLTGEAKWNALAETKILINIHRQPLAYFEWVRVLEAICNGCVVVSEGSRGGDPLVVGEHYVAGRISALGLLTDEFLSDPSALESIRNSAYTFVRDRLPMSAAVEGLLALAETLEKGKARRSLRPGRETTAVKTPARRSRTERLREIGKNYFRELRARWSRQAEVLDALRRSQAVQKRILLGQVGLNRTLQRLQVDERQRVTPVAEVSRTPAYDAASPRVTVIVPLYNHADEVTHALDSVARSSFENLEVAVLDDASSDHSLQAVLDWMRDHPAFPALLLQNAWNRGLGATRNALFEAARGEYVLALDADNELYPTAASKLAAALDDDPDAVFAYPILEVHEDGLPVTLMGYQPWEPARLKDRNYIDALALIRRREAIALGGYTEDLRLYGWEDYDLWCRVVDRGRYGIHVPEILARYAQAEHSMISITAIDDAEAMAVLRHRYRNLFGPRSVQPRELEAADAQLVG